MPLSNSLRDARDFVAFLRTRAGDVPAYLFAALAALVVIGLALWGFVVLVDAYATESEVRAFDAGVRDLATWIATPELAGSMALTTNLAAPLLVVGVALGLAAYFAIRRLWDYLWMLILALGLGSALLYALKLIFDRARPVEGTAYDAHGASFPSGHSFTALVLYGLLAYLVWQITTNAWARTVAIVFAVFATIGVGLSRLYLGVHWATDVLGGWLAGAAWLVFSIMLVRFLEARRDHHAAVAPPLHPEDDV